MGVFLGLLLLEAYIDVCAFLGERPSMMLTSAQRGPLSVLSVATHPGTGLSPAL